MCVYQLCPPTRQVDYPKSKFQRFSDFFALIFSRIFNKQMWLYGLKEKDLLIDVVDPEKFIISLIWFSQVATTTVRLVQLSTTSLLIARKVRLQRFMFILTYYSIEPIHFRREKEKTKNRNEILMINYCTARTLNRLTVNPHPRILDRKSITGKLGQRHIWTKIHKKIRVLTFCQLSQTMDYLFGNDGIYTSIRF